MLNMKAETGVYGILKAYEYEIVFAAAVLFCIYFIQAVFMKSKKNVPPGPWGLPIVGYLPFLTENVHLDITELGRKYGDVFRLKMGALDVFILHGADAIKDALSNLDLLGKPPGQMVEMVFGNSPFAGSDLNMWKEQRNFLVQSMKELGLGKTQIESDIQSEILHFLDVVRSHGSNPMDLNTPLAPSMSNNITALLFSKRLEYDDPNRRMLDKNLDEGNDALNQTSYVVFFPWLQNIPFANKFLDFNRALRCFTNMRNYFGQEIENHKKTFDKKNARDFVDNYFIEMESRKQKNPNTTFSEKTLLLNMQDLFAAGSETVRTAVLWDIRLVSAFPGSQKRIQKEIQEVIGPDRFPEFTDMKKMPYTHAFIMEVFRWKTVVPLGLMRHVTTEDLKIIGYNIPKGSTVMANFWNINHDPRYWKEPDTFMPERFLSADGTSVVKSNYWMPFSYGRRACPGETMGIMEVFLYLVALLQKFDILLPEEEMKPNLEGKMTIVYRTPPFKVLMRART